MKSRRQNLRSAVVVTLAFALGLTSFAPVMSNSGRAADSQNQQTKDKDSGKNSLPAKHDIVCANSPLGDELGTKPQHKQWATSDESLIVGRIIFSTAANSMRNFHESAPPSLQAEHIRIQI